jgi:hypothetical protein
MTVITLSDYRHREPYRIVIGRGLWRGYEVAVQPPTETHKLQVFPTLAHAEAFAVELSRVEGWPVFSDVDDDGGQAA